MDEMRVSLGWIPPACPPLSLPLVCFWFAPQFHPLRINTGTASFLQGTAHDTPNQRRETKTHFDSDEQREFLLFFDF